MRLDRRRRMGGGEEVGWRGCGWVEAMRFGRRKEDG
jgi:hypothetical protein